jgi:hypothetical protein
MAVPVTRVIPPTPHAVQAVGIPTPSPNHLAPAPLAPSTVHGCQDAIALPSSSRRSDRSSSPAQTLPGSPGQPYRPTPLDSTFTQGSNGHDSIEQALSEVFSEALADLSAGGRVSDETLSVLSNGYKKLDRLVIDLSDQTGLPEKQILALWERRTKHVGSGFHPWNAYSNYFKNNEEGELRGTFGSVDRPNGASL